MKADALTYVSTETQRSIGEWADAMFGPAKSLASIAARANREMAELVQGAVDGASDEHLALEAADVAICLYRQRAWPARGGDVKPKRIQLRRTKGWRKPANTVVVARPSVFGNPFTAKSAIDAGYAHGHESAAWTGRFLSDCFREWMTPGAEFQWWQGPESDQRKAAIKASLPELRGKNLACWCPLDRPCHADVLLELANR